MGCTPASALSGITYDCDVPTGGLKRIFLAYRQGDGSTAIGFMENTTPPSTDGNPIALIESNTGTTITGSGGTYLVPDQAGAIAGSGVSGTPNVFYELEFNRKDGFSNFADVKTVNADGSVEAVPSIQVEMPKMDFDKHAELIKMSQGNVELVAAIETAAGTYHIVGCDFGLYAGTVDGSSGNSRTEKNRWQLTLTGSETELAVNVETSVDFNDIVTLEVA